MLDRSQLMVQQAEYMAAGLLTLTPQSQDGADFLEREADGARLQDEAQTLGVCLPIEAITGGGAPWWRQQADALVVADGLGVEAQLGRKLADAPLRCHVYHSKNILANWNLWAVAKVIPAMVLKVGLGFILIASTLRVFRTLDDVPHKQPPRSTAGPSQSAPRNGLLALHDIWPSSRDTDSCRTGMGNRSSHLTSFLIEEWTEAAGRHQLSWPGPCLVVADVLL